ncbi:MAG: hypothetical protein NW215_03930 [Hyphomicrobiales bacterium]|nr:hypothetical protein [Hyphomicrobiales bacterium]
MSDMSTLPQGNFIAGLNRGKEPGSKLPDFTGRLSVPGREEAHAIALWANQDKLGRTYFAGRMDHLPITDDVAAQIEHLSAPDLRVGDVMDAGSNLSLRPRELVLFANRFREPVATDTEEQAAERAKRPHYWGRLNPGDGTPVVALSVWLRQNRYQQPLLAGATSYPQPGRNQDAAALDQTPEPDQAAANPALELTAPVGAGGRGRKGREAR